MCYVCADTSDTSVYTKATHSYGNENSPGSVTHSRKTKKMRSTHGTFGKHQLQLACELPCIVVTGEYIKTSYNDRNYM